MGALEHRLYKLLTNHNWGLPGCEFWLSKCTGAPEKLTWLRPGICGIFIQMAIFFGKERISWLPPKNKVADENLHFQRHTSFLVKLQYFIFELLSIYTYSPNLLAFWFLEKNALRKIRVSGTVLKSVYFKKPVTRISFLSKALSFSK